MTPTTPSAEALAAALKREIAAKSTSTVAELVSPLIDQLAVTAIADATSDPLLKKIAHLTHCWEHMRWCKETSDAIEDLIAATAALEAQPKAQAQAAEPVSFLAPQDQADLERLNDLFLDDMPWDLEKERMRHLAELGVIRHVSGGYYAITAFGRHCIAPEWGLPLRTIEQINADQARKAQERQA